MEPAKKVLLEQLERYRSYWFGPTKTNIKENPEEIHRMVDFLKNNENCFDRSLLIGHVTGAGLVVTPDYSRVLLTLHKKLGKWLQLGGHCDGNPRVHESALRECEEESGLTELALIDVAPLLKIPESGAPLFFDIDIHEIPERKTEPAHYHYDFRYLVRSNHPEKIAMSDESDALKWFTTEEAMKVTQERSMHRQFEKLLFLKTQL